MKRDRTGCPILAKNGIHESDCGLAAGRDDIEIADQEVIEICLNCPFENCILKSRERELVKKGGEKAWT